MERLRLAAAVGTACIAFCAEAQTPPSPPSATVGDQPPADQATVADKSVSSAAASGAPASSSGQVSDIVVTAQRRSQRLQDVPVSVAALGARQLADSGASNIQDLGQLVPSLSVSNAVGFTITFLRGVGSTALGPGIENPVSIYLDGVYYASSSSSLFDFSNIDRVEVLKGPQGTLFGRNATGGLIQVFTRDPTQDFRFVANAGYGNYGTVKGDAYIAGGIAPSLAMDLSLQGSTQSDGWGRNLATGQDTYRNYHNLTARSKLVFTPGTTTKITLIGDITDQRNAFNGQRAPKGTLTNPALATPPQGGGPYDINGNINPLFKNRNYGLSGKIEQDLGFARLMNLVAYRHSRSEFNWDVDFTPKPHLDGHLHELEKQVSEELQLSSQPGGKLNWTAGLFYFHADGAYDPAGVTSADVPTNLFGPFVTINPYGFQTTDSIAGFGQATYEFLPQTNLTFGARYTHEKRTLDGFTTGVLFGTTAPIPLSTVPKTSISFQRPTFRVSLDHRFSPEVLAYASFNTGFKSGGYNTQFPTDPPFRPERLNAYEIGVKSDLLDRRLRLNLASYYYDYTNIQVQKVGLASTGIINGASARIYGAEADFEAAVTPAFRINGSLAYTNAKFQDFPNAPFGTPLGGVPVVAADASGNDIGKSPRFQGSVNGNYRIELGGGSKLFLDGFVTYNSGYALEPDNIIRQKRFAKLNASIRWASAEDRYSVRLWAANLTNRATINYESTLADGTHNVSFEAPRTFGITVGVNYR